MPRAIAWAPPSPDLWPAATTTPWPATWRPCGSWRRRSCRSPMPWRERPSASVNAATREALLSRSGPVATPELPRPVQVQAVDPGVEARCGDQGQGAGEHGPPQGVPEGERQTPVHVGQELVQMPGGIETGPQQKGSPQNQAPQRDPRIDALRRHLPG